MLHSLITILILNSPAKDVCQLADLPYVDFVTTQHRERLAKCLAAKTIFVQARKKRQPRVWAPGDHWFWCGGIQLPGARILTSAALSQGYYFGDSVRGGGIIKHYPKQGLLIVDGKNSSRTLERPEVKLQEGRVYFAIDRNGDLLRIPIESKGVGEFAYYWRTALTLPMGTPLFDAHGRWATMVAFSRGGLGTFILPSDAFDVMVSEKASDEHP